MDARRYFLLGDVFSNSVVAVLTAWLVHSLLSPHWAMLPAMLAGMVLGMIIANLCCLLCLMRFFGAMEIMLPAMVTGMLAGMAVAMSHSMGAMALLDHLLLALAIALISTAAIWAASQRLSGEQLCRERDDDD